MFSRILFTYFEDLSNEIFYEIFEYLDGYDLYRAFDDLNARFNHLLIYLPIPLKIKLNCPNSIEQLDHYRNIIQSNRQRILSLSLENNRLINVFFSNYLTSSLFKRLESIVLEGIESDTLLSTISYFKSIPCLFSLTVCLPMFDMECPLDIYYSIFSLNSLKYVKLSTQIDIDLYYVDLFPVILHDDEHSKNTEYLTIDHRCNVVEFYHIISLLPKLRSLKCANLQNSIFPTNIVPSISFSHLTSLDIEHTSISFTEFASLATQVLAKIKILKIAIISDMTYMNAQKWEELITNSMPNLCKFYLYHHECQVDSEYVSFCKSIEGFMSSFWTERKWYVECVIDTGGIHYSIHPDTHTLLSIENISDDRLFDEYTCEHILSHIPFTHLNINCELISIESFLQIIYLLRHVNSIQILTLPIIQMDWLADSTIADIRFKATFQNRIIRIIVDEINTIEQVHFILHICPCVQYLQMNISQEINLDMLIRFILIKSSTFTPDLKSLCLNIPNADDTIVDQLRKQIKFEQLLINYTISRIANDVCIKWN